MKRRALLAHLQEHGCVPVREGSSHSIWSNPRTGRKEAIPRHNEIKKGLARSIYRNLSVPVPPGD
jgi:mRNA interferase HicA